MAATAKSTAAGKDPKAAQAAQAADDDDNEAAEEEEEGQQGQASRDLNRVRDDGEEAESVDADKLKKVRLGAHGGGPRWRRLIRRGRYAVRAWSSCGRSRSKRSLGP